MSSGGISAGITVALLNTTNAQIAQMALSFRHINITKEIIRLTKNNTNYDSWNKSYQKMFKNIYLTLLAHMALDEELYTVTSLVQESLNTIENPKNLKITKILNLSKGKWADSLHDFEKTNKESIKSWGNGMSSIFRKAFRYSFKILKTANADKEKIDSLFNVFHSIFSNMTTTIERIGNEKRDNKLKKTKTLTKTELSDMLSRYSDIDKWPKDFKNIFESTIKFLYSVNFSEEVINKVYEYFNSAFNYYMENQSFNNIKKVSKNLKSLILVAAYYHRFDNDYSNLNRDEETENIFVIIYNIMRFTNVDKNEINNFFIIFENNYMSLLK